MEEYGAEISTRLKKLDDKIRKLQEEKRQVAERVKTEKERNELARRVGAFILKSYEKNPDTYTDVRNDLENILVSDFDRQFFALEPLSEDDPRRPKKRGRKAKEELQLDILPENGFTV